MIDEADRPVSPRGTFARRLAIAFALTAALTAALAAVILSVVWAGQFEEYVRKNLQRTADGAADLLAREYAQDGGWTIDALSQMPRFGVMSGLGLQVLDPEGRIIYDDTSMHGLLRGGAAGMTAPDARAPSGPVVYAPVLVNREPVGFVRLWVIGPAGLLSENDLAFRRSSFIGIAIAALLAVVGASLAGLAYASGLVRPIERITTTAAALRAGERDARTGMEPVDEIGLLGRTLDEMADAIEADREMERRLTADVAHELRTPLQAIQATVEAMQDGVLPADDERLSVVRDETVRLARLTAGILELTRLERGAVTFATGPVDLTGVVRASVDAHRMLIESCGLELVEDIAEGVATKGDPDRLAQAVGNLLSNAARYTPEGGVIEVRLKRDGDRAVIEVSDTGIGIAEEDLNKVFARFWRADDARDRATGGLGIGLAMVKEIVERHGGLVGASRRETGGSTFSIRLPLT